MANAFNIPEVALSELADATHAINTSTRKGPYQPLVARAIDSDYDTGVNADTPAKLEAGAALFYQKAVGHPWVMNKSVNSTKQVTFETKADPLAAPTDVTTLFPNYDYDTFK